MGREVRGTVWVEDAAGVRSGQGRALLETEDLVFRGEMRLKIPYAAMTSVTADDGQLMVEYAGGRAVFEIGGEAAAWAHRILNPVSLLEKLGVKPGHRVVVIDVFEDRFLADLQQRATVVIDGTVDGPDDKQYAPADLIFYGVEQPAALGLLAVLRNRITKNGAIWVIHPRGRRDLRDMDVIEAGLAAGLVDVKVARFSPTHTAEKLVVRLRDR